MLYGKLFGLNINSITAVLAVLAVLYGNLFGSNINCCCVY